MWDHMATSHVGKDSEEANENFEFFLTGTFRKSLERQIDEARRIEKSKGRRESYHHSGREEVGDQGEEGTPEQVRRRGINWGEATSGLT